MDEQGTRAAFTAAPKLLGDMHELVCRTVESDGSEEVRAGNARRIHSCSSTPRGHVLVEGCSAQEPMTIVLPWI